MPAVVIAVMSTCVVAATAVAGGVPVLGSKRFYKPGNTIGWGTPHPSEIFNGGDPSGLVTHIHWTRWGAGVSYGRGLTYAPKPSGGYYRQMVPIKLRADRLGRCSKRGPRAYTHLHVRVVDHPGGTFGSWGPWSAHGGNICLTTAQMYP